MGCRDLMKAQRKIVLSIVLTTALTACLQVSAMENALENAQLTLLLRELDMLDRTAKQASASALTSSRYRFDYARLHADIARVRVGIEEYLTPPRAQPRDPGSLSGEYRLERDAKP